jgi:alpha-beta hydrolase superfamily lysophospholipase
MKFNFRIIYLILLAAISVPTLHAQDLPRHGVIGLTLSPPDITKPEDPKTNPPTVKTVAPGSAGDAAGIQAGDILRQLDGAPVASTTDFVTRIARHLAGDRVPIVVARNGQELTNTATLKPRPYETNPDADVLYNSVTIDGTRRRTIITRPKSAGHFPAVLIMAGLGCYSLDGANNPYAGVITALAKQNFVTMRVEEPGQGDSEGPACTDVKATAELQAQSYIAGLKALKSYDYVDSAKIFVFAHSLGPLVGSLVIPRESVRGFIAAETIGRSWFEYGLENVRLQSALLGESLDEVERDVRMHEKCAHDFYVLHHTYDEVTKIGQQCADMVRSYAGMPYTFMQQIGDINLAAQWKQVDIPVLVLYGTSDPATSADESRYLVNLINSFHPGRATYVELPGMGHDLYKYDSQLEFLTRRNNPAKQHAFDDEFNDAVLKWLNQQLQV